MATRIHQDVTQRVEIDHLLSSDTLHIIEGMTVEHTEFHEISGSHGGEYED